MFEFAWPWLACGLLLPWLARRYLPALPVSRRRALQVPFYHQLPLKSATRTRGKVRRLPARKILLASAYVLLVSAAMRPQWLGESLPLSASGRDLMLAVDISGSMGASDFVYNAQPLTRLRAVQQVATEFLQQREGDRVGLILFADKPHLQTPLTFDLATLQHFLLEANVGLAGTQTAMGDAIGLSLKRLKDSPQATKVVVLLTDGANTAGRVNPLDAAYVAAQQGVKIHTIGVGEQTDTGIFRQRAAGLDVVTLRQIAQLTGGQFFLAKNTPELQGIYRLIDQLEPIDTQRANYRPRVELYHWPLTVVVLIFCVFVWIARRADG